MEIRLFDFPITFLCLITAYNTDRTEKSGMVAAVFVGSEFLPFPSFLR